MAEPAAARRSRLGRMRAGTATGLALLVVWGVLAAPDRPADLTPSALRPH